MMKQLLFFLSLSMFFALSTIHAQWSAMPELTLTSSVAARGTGSSGLLTQDAFDAFRGNPANLTFTEPLRIGFFRDPYQWASPDFPSFLSYRASGSIGEYGYIGIDYYNWDQEARWYTEEDLEIGRVVKILRRYFSLAYAGRFDDGLAIGGELTYAYNSFPSGGIGSSGNSDATAKNLFLSLGALYVPEWSDNRVTFAMSWMNIGKTVAYSGYPQSDPPPSTLHMGGSFDVMHESLASLRLSVEANREVARITSGSGRSENSLEGISDWHHAPRDIDLNGGIVFEIKPIPLDYGLTYFQSMYAGLTAPGIYHSAANSYSNGMRAGLQFDNLRLSFGVAGAWYRKYAYFISWAPYSPEEVFDFTLSYLGPVGSNNQSEPVDSPAFPIAVSAGVGGTYRVGRFRQDGDAFSTVRYPDKVSYQIEAAFYISPSSALVSSLGYSPGCSEYIA